MTARRMVGRLRHGPAPAAVATPKRAVVQHLRVGGSDHQRVGVVEIQLPPRPAGVDRLEQAVVARGVQRAGVHRIRDEVAADARRQPSIGRPPRLALVARSVDPAAQQGHVGRGGLAARNRQAGDLAAVWSAAGHVVQHGRVVHPRTSGRRRCRTRSRISLEAEPGDGRRQQRRRPDPCRHGPPHGASLRPVRRRVPTGPHAVGERGQWREDALTPAATSRIDAPSSRAPEQERLQRVEQRLTPTFRAIEVGVVGGAGQRHDLHLAGVDQVRLQPIAILGPRPEVLLRKHDQRPRSRTRPASQAWRPVVTSKASASGPVGTRTAGGRCGGAPGSAASTAAT